MPTAEIIGAVAAATLGVAALEGLTPIPGLGMLYLLAVLFVAIRRGEVAALMTAVLAVLVLNFLFIEPRYRLTIADPHNVVALAVFLICALVVGRLAAAARERAEESASRAELAATRERESMLLANVASSLLTQAGGRPPGSVENRLSGILAASGLRVELAQVPCPRSDERAFPLGTSGRKGWLYTSRTEGWDEASFERMAEPLARLIDVGLAREAVMERTAEAEATRRAEVAKTAVLHAISHDLRTPLTGITTAAEALRGECLSSMDRAELLGVITGEAGRMSRLVGDLLDLSRVEAGAVHPQLDWCDLGDTVATAAEHVRALSGEHPIALELSSDLPLVHADPAQLERVFENLLENAVSASPPDRAVEVKGSVSQDRIVVLVTDRGKGIPRSDRQRVFEPFVRLGSEDRGAGLGLAICRGFVEANRGRIQVSSRPGTGTSFSVSFPVVEQPSSVA